MSVRKRTWKTKRGEDKTSWIVDYKDQAGKRHIKTFTHKKAADDYASRTRIAVKEGRHVADSATVTVNEACDTWLAGCAKRELEASTLAQYQQHVDLHIKPFIGATKLSHINVGFVRRFIDRLGDEGRSRAMVRAVVSSLSSILSDAQEQDLVATNAVRDLSRRRRGGSDKKADRYKLRVGVDIPTPEEIRAIVGGAENLRDQVSLETLATTGLRSSEFRGLRWQDLNLKVGELHVRVRADFLNKLGPPKSAAGTRTIPLLPRVTRNLRVWMMQCPRKKTDLLYVFPNDSGDVQWHQNFIVRTWHQVQLDADVVIKDGDTVKPKYSGMHALRHFFASWCLNRKRDGGLELPAKVVQERLGHSSIQVTFDTYGHLFPRMNDAIEMLRAQKKLFG